MGKYPIRAHFRLYTRVGPGPFWVVVWVHIKGDGCSQDQQGLFSFRSLHFSLGQRPAKWALQAVEDESPIERYYPIRSFSSRMPQLTSPSGTKPHARKCTGSSYIAKTMFFVDVRPAPGCLQLFAFCLHCCNVFATFFSKFVAVVAVKARLKFVWQAEYIYSVFGRGCCMGASEPTRFWLFECGFLAAAGRLTFVAGIRQRRCGLGYMATGGYYRCRDRCFCFVLFDVTDFNSPAVDVALPRKEPALPDGRHLPPSSHCHSICNQHAHLRAVGLMLRLFCDGHIQATRMHVCLFVWFTVFQ